MSGISSQLHVDLSGFLPLGEKRKLLNKFIAKAEESQVNNILKDCKNLPSTQYNLLKLSLADKFHRFDLIIELLYEGDSDIMSGAVSKRWLYEGEDNSLTDCEFLLSKLFPNVSHICRQKVLHKIGRYVLDEAKADRIWDAVEQRYGFDAAFPLLQSCSKAKINSVIATRKLKLSGYQLVQILQKYPDVGLEYIKDDSHYVRKVCTVIGRRYSRRVLAFARSSSTNPNCSPFDYVYKNHPEDFLDLCINHPDKIDDFQLGRSRSTKLIREYRSKLLEHPTKTSSLLKFDRIKREFSNEEFQTLFESAMPKDSHKVNGKNMWRWVSTVPINKRLEMTNQAFMKLYQINLDERPEFLTTDYIILLPPEKRIAMVQWKIENDKDCSVSYKGISVYHYDDDENNKRAWCLLKPSSHSVPELQKLLLIERNVGERATLSKFLIQTCYINEDLPQLLNVLVLLSKRSRNDQAEVRNAIFKTIDDIMGEMEFSKEHWDVIIEMIQVALVFKDFGYSNDRYKEKIVGKCIAFHLASKLPLNNLVSMHIKLKIQASSRSWTNSHIKNPADTRTLLDLYAKELEILQQANNLCCYKGKFLDPEAIKEFIIKFIEEICRFNDTEDLEPISISSHQWLKNNFEKIAKEEEARVNENYSKNSSYSFKFAKRLINIIQSLRKDKNLFIDAFNGSEDLNPKILVCSPSSSILLHFLGKDPSHLIHNWSTTVPRILETKSWVEFRKKRKGGHTKYPCLTRETKSMVKLMKKLKYWNYSTFVDETMKICSEIVNQTTEKDSGMNQKCNAVLVLSVLRETSEFLALVAEFYPPESKVDVFAKKSDEDYEIRKTFAKSLVNVTAPLLTFPAIEKFCVGDYLKLAIGALYSHIDRAPEFESLSFLRQKLVNIAVSLQKHIIRLYCRMIPVEDKIRVLNEIESTNVSIRYVVFLEAVKLFRSSPSLDTWMILKRLIEKTSTDDASIVKYFYGEPQLDTCPVEYISHYVEACIALLRKIGPRKMEYFLFHLKRIIDKIPEIILDDIILYEHVDQVSFDSSLCENYLHSSTTRSTLEHRLSNMWCLLQNVIRNGWDEKTSNSHYPTRSLVLSFINGLCLHKMNDSTKFWLKRQILQTLLAKFRAESVTKFFTEILYLELALLLIKEVDDNEIERLKSFGRSLARFIDSLAVIYGGELIWTIKYTVKGYVEKCFEDLFSDNEGVIVELIAGILETSYTRQNQILSITFLQNANPKTSDLIGTMEKVKSILNESDDVIAQWYGSPTIPNKSDRVLYEWSESSSY